MKNQQKTNCGARCFHTTCIDTYIVHYSQNTTTKKNVVAFSANRETTKQRGLY